MKKIEMWTDGAAISNPNGHSGAGVVLAYNGSQKEFGFYLGIGSNNRAELLAIVEGIKLLKEPCEVVCYTDSQYCERVYAKAWRMNANIDEWNLLHQTIKDGSHTLTIQWIRKDSHTNNIRAHKLANSAANQKG